MEAQVRFRPGRRFDRNRFLAMKKLNAGPWYGAGLARVWYGVFVQGVLGHQAVAIGLASALAGCVASGAAGSGATQSLREVKPYELGSRYTTVYGETKANDVEIVPSIRRVEPIYPRRAAERSIQGWVVMRFRLDPAGWPQAVRVIDSAPAKTFDKAAVSAVSKWRYRPATRNGRPVHRLGISAKLTFRLDWSDSDANLEMDDGTRWSPESTDQHPGGNEIVGAPYFAQTKACAQVKLSPDGRRVSAVLNKGGEAYLRIIDAMTLEADSTYHLKSGGEIITYGWSGNNVILMESSRDTIRVDVERRSTELLDGRRWIARPVNDHGPIVSIGAPSGVAIGLQGIRSSIYRFNSARAEFEEVPTPYRLKQVVLRKNGEVRWALSISDQRPRLVTHEDGGWKQHASLSGDTRLIGYTSVDDVVYLVDEDAAGQPAVFGIGSDGEKRKLAQNGRHTPSGFVFDQDDRLVAVAFEEETPKLVVLQPDSRVARFNLRLEQQLTSQHVLIRSVADDGRHAIAAVYSDRRPLRYLLLDLHQGQARELCSAFAELDERMEAPTEVVRIDASDGLALHGRVTRGLRRDGDTQASADSAPKARPVRGLVVVPADDKSWVFDRDAQFLAANGFSVLRVSYRGTPGFGPAYDTTNRRRWNRRILQDVVEATRWAIDKGVASEGRPICVMGRGYGAYVAAMAAIIAPKLYTCMVGISGFYNVPQAVDDADAPASYVGNLLFESWLEEADPTVREVSPFHRANELRTATLLVHGQKSRDVLASQSETMARALEKYGTTVERFMPPTQKFDRPGPRTALYRRMAHFLNRQSAAADKSPPISTSPVIR